MLIEWVQEMYYRCGGKYAARVLLLCAAAKAAEWVFPPVAPLPAELVGVYAHTTAEVVPLALLALAGLLVMAGLMLGWFERLGAALADWRETAAARGTRERTPRFEVFEAEDARA